MKALQQIIERVAANRAQPFALATLVQTEGSTYRKPGARLLVEANGATLGVLSGGCLEEEIGRYGRRVINDGSAVLLSFDTRRLYGCDGRLKILVEPLPAAGTNGNLITEVGRLLAQRDVCRISTCFEGGPLGSELLARLSEYRPLDFEAGVRNLYAPVGLDIGSEAPEEIGLSIVSEVAAVLSNRCGGFLRERKIDIRTAATTTSGQAA